eukprot:SAG22_NODE_163_length_16829_cov_9.946204_12_plen_63_part_00
MHINLEAQLQAFKKEQEAKQAEEMAGFLAKLKKEEEEAKQAAATAAGASAGAGGIRSRNSYR